MATTMKKKNDWLVPQSMLTGACIVMVAMIIPQVREMAVKATEKIGSLVGLN